MKKILLLFFIVLGSCGCYNDSHLSNIEQEVDDQDGIDGIDDQDGEDSGTLEKVTYFFNFIETGYYEVFNDVAYGVEFSDNNEMIMYWGGVEQSNDYVKNLNQFTSTVDGDQLTLQKVEENVLEHVNTTTITFTKYSSTNFNYTIKTSYKAPDLFHEEEHINENIVEADKPTPIWCVSVSKEEGPNTITFDFNVALSSYNFVIKNDDDDDYTGATVYKTESTLYLKGFVADTYFITLTAESEEFEDSYENTFEVTIP